MLWAALAPVRRREACAERRPPIETVEVLSIQPKGLQASSQDLQQGVESHVIIFAVGPAILYAYHHIRRIPKFRPLFADMPTKTLHAFYEKNDCTLIAKFLLQCRRERTKIVRYHNFDIRT